jgi:cytochrome c oxidase cbb3-type subunit 3
MNDSHDPLLLDHEADGIRELDNKLPRWWVWLFYLTIAFSGVYLVYYHVMAAGDLKEHGQMRAEYLREMEIGDKIKQAAMKQFEDQLPSLQPSSEAAVLAGGQDTFARLCAPCHRADGGGLVGPNLTDDYWIHGSNFVDHVKVILHGVPDKGMLSWRGMLKPSEIIAVASYVRTLRGAKLATPGKLPENQAPAQTEPNPFE